MTDYREIGIDDREMFRRAQRDQEYENNEGSFVTLFLWRHRWQIRLAVRDGVVYLAARLPEDGRPMHYPPVVPPDRPVREALERIGRDLSEQNAPFLIRYANESFVGRLRREGAGEYEIRETRDEFDYVYSVPELVRLSGRPLHGQRNHLNQFLRKYEYRYEELTPAHRRDCLAIYDRWMANHAGRLREEGERLATEEALTHWEALGLMGGIVYVGGEPVAFTVGEDFRPGMALIHLEKADPAYRGAFQLINQQFAYRALRGYETVNRQEDMGIEGIRKAKMSYHPIRMVPKYDIVRR
jgi:hypothetical protein